MQYCNVQSTSNLVTSQLDLGGQKETDNRMTFFVAGPLL